MSKGLVNTKTSKNNADKKERRFGVILYHNLGFRIDIEASRCYYRIIKPLGIWF